MEIWTTLQSTRIAGVEGGTSRNPALESIPRAERLGVVVLATVLLSSCLLGGTVLGTPQPFPTPESAITFFIECVKAEDYVCALSACAVDEIASGFDYEALIKRLRVMAPTAQYLPSEYGLYAMRNRHAMEYYILHQLSWMALSVVLPEEYQDFLDMRMLLDTTVDFDNVVSQMDPQRLMNLEIAEIGTSHLLDSERNVQNLARQAEMHGADAATSRAVLYKIDEDYFVGGFQLLQYDGNWLIASLNEVLIGQPAIGALIKVSSPSEFRAMLAQ